MPYRVFFSPDEAFGAIELSGTIRWDDVAAAMCALFGHPGWFPSCAVLWDTRAITSLNVTPADLPGARGLMEALASARTDGRSAVIARSLVEVKLAATLASLGPPSRREIGTFDRLEDALRFLGRRTIPEEAVVIASSAAVPEEPLPRPFDSAAPVAPAAGTPERDA
jgi:hypothetical protein